MCYLYEHYMVNFFIFFLGSASPIPCPAGKYCQTPGLDNYTGECQEGYYCTLGASQANPTDGSTGDRCPAGYYCPAGSSVPIACSMATFSPSTGNTQPSDCLNCTAGEYCGDYNLTATSGENYCGQFMRF